MRFFSLRKGKGKGTAPATGSMDDLYRHKASALAIAAELTAAYLTIAAELTSATTTATTARRSDSHTGCAQNITHGTGTTMASSRASGLDMMFVDVGSDTDSYGGEDATDDEGGTRSCRSSIYHPVAASTRRVTARQGEASESNPVYWLVQASVERSCSGDRSDGFNAVLQKWRAQADLAPEASTASNDPTPSASPTTTTRTMLAIPTPNVGCPEVQHRRSSNLKRRSGVKLATQPRTPAHLKDRVVLADFAGQPTLSSLFT